MPLCGVPLLGTLPPNGGKVIRHSGTVTGCLKLVIKVLACGLAFLRGLDHDLNQGA